MNKLKILLLMAALTMGLASAPAQPLSPTERSMEAQGMVDVTTVDSTIRVSLMYARTDNFTGQLLYTDLHRAYLHPKAARALAQAQRYLKAAHPHLSLKIYDACRPMSIQQKMWDTVKGTAVQDYVSNPANGGGLHNYGMAVDITLCNEQGDSLAMGTKVDHMSPLSHIDREDELLRQGRLSKEAVSNRRILRKAMTQAGFKPLRTEWWHFNLIYRAEARRNYPYVK